MNDPSEDRTAGGKAAFGIVGIGASAGGLEALTTLLEHVHEEGFAFVVVQHRPPHQASLLPELLGRATPMPVVEIVDGDVVEPHRVYVAPAGSQLALLRGTFHLVPSAIRLPVDFFFRSLAEERGARAIGIVLSGMGSDGTLGLRAIRERGGICLAQDPTTAKFDRMPQSAIDAGFVDGVLAPEAFGEELRSLARHSYLDSPPGDRPRPPAMQALHVLLRDSFGQDLSGYKQSTIERRVARRMAIRKIEGLDEYVSLVATDAEELATLHRELLIHVTSFFRDHPSFDALKEDVLAPIVARRPPGEPVRVWVPACSTGEEAYSIAIALLEVLGPSASEVVIQIFGTDVEPSAIERARRGTFPASIEADVSAERLERYFVSAAAGYQVSRKVRDLVVFSVQDVAKDPPFSRIDLVSCRNMLIYMQAALQHRVLSTFHYALKPDGILWLGTSETIGSGAEDLFFVVDRKAKSYQKKSLATGRHLVQPFRGITAVPRPPGAGERRPLATAQQLADRTLLDHYAPPSILVNDDLEALSFRGETAPYLSPASGQARLDVMHLVRPELHLALWNAIEHARRALEPARSAPVLVRAAQGDPRMAYTVGLEVAPLTLPEAHGHCWLIIFHPLPTPSMPYAASEKGGESEARPNDRARVLEQEVVIIKEVLQSTIEELESSNEELKSTNEELQSANEELQSSNEELETAKEELQSSNEELTTVNDELKHRLSDLAQRDNDLNNVLRAVRDPLLIVDASGRLGRFTDAAADLFHLVEGDAGRAVGFLRVGLGGLDLERLVARAIERVSPVVEEILAANGRWYALTVRPFATGKGTISGTLVALEDIDERKRSSALAIDVAAYAERLLSAVSHPLVMLDERHRVLWTNGPFFAMFRVTPVETYGNLFHNLGNGQWAHPKLREHLDATLRDGKPFDDFVLEHDFEAVGAKRTKIAARPVRGVVGEATLALVSIVDVGTPL